MKILHVAYIYPHTPNVADGITTVVYNVTKELVKRGHEVAVYTSDMLTLHGNGSMNSGHTVINGVNVYHSRSFLRSKTFIATPATLSLLSKNLNSFDVIHIHDCRSFQGISSYVFAKMKRVPYVYQAHGSYLSSLINSPGKALAKIGLDKLVSSRIVRNASRVIALSQMEAEQYRGIGIPDKKIAIVPNGIDLLPCSELQGKGFFKRKFEIQERKKMLLYLGRIHETKGIALLLKAYAQMIKTQKCSNTILVIAGPDDGYLAEAEALVSAFGISDSVLFTGYIDSRDKIGALVDADIFVTPSFFGFPMTFLEACAVGTPIVTTTLGDTLEWINGNVGFVTSPSCQDLSNALYALVTDFGLAESFSNNCRKIAQEVFSMEKIVDKLEETYYEVICK